MTVDWAVPTPIAFDPAALLASVTRLLEPTSAIRLSWYALDGSYGRGTRLPSTPSAPSAPDEGGTIVLGDHEHECYLEITGSVGEFGPEYRVGPRRNQVSWIVALLTAACLAELTGAQLLDDAQILGRYLGDPADVLTPVRALRRHEGEPAAATLVRLADAAGAPTLADPWRSAAGLPAGEQRAGPHP